MSDDYVDEVAVERRVAGDDSVSLTRAEAEHAWRVMEGRGWSAASIAERLGVEPRSVQRWRGGETSPIAVHPKGRDVMTTDLIAEGKRSSSRRAQVAADKAQQALDRLREVLAAEQQRAVAVAEVERLERELAAARARARGQAVRDVAEAPDAKAVRAWARAAGVECPANGRLPRAVVEQYEAATA